MSCPECSGRVHDGTCHSCGLVVDKIYDVGEIDGSRRTPFLPAGGLSMDSRSFDYKDRQRIYGGARAIKTIKQALYLPESLCEGAMVHFLKISSGNNQGTSFSILAALGVLLAARDWDFPVLKRELIDVLELDERKFFYTRRRLGITIPEYSAEKLAWKFVAEHNLGMDVWADIMKWMRRIEGSGKAAAATAVYMIRPPMMSIVDIALWFETTRTMIEKTLRKLSERYAI